MSAADAPDGRTHDGAPRRVAIPIDRAVAIAALVLLTLAGWGYLLAWPMPMPDGRGALTLSYTVLTAVMWLLMMIAMMAPSVAPVVMLFARVSHQTEAPVARTVNFIGGYFAAWLAFSASVALLQVFLLQIQWIDAMGVTQNPTFRAAIFIAVGAYQLSPIKSACLTHCRSPVQFLTRRYRAGLSGAWRMGLEHGLYCVGCCWLLMLLLFIGGVMNLWWVIGIACLAAIEKLAPRSDIIVRAVGAALMVIGVILLLR